MPCQGPWGGGYGGGDSYRKDYLEAERRLCEARWIILRLVERGAPVAADLKDLVTYHRVEQLKHRRGYKKHVLDHFDATLERIRDDEREVRRRGGTIGAKLVAQVKTLRAERKRIAAITDAQLLSDYWGSEKRLASDVVDHDVNDDE